MGDDLYIQVDEIKYLQENPDAFTIWLYEMDLEYNLTDVDPLIEYYIQEDYPRIAEILIDFKNEKGI